MTSVERERRVLVVDDNAPLAENVAEILEAHGYLADVATHPADALKRVSVQRYGLMLVDMRMPGMSGPELTRAVRQVDPALPVLGISAFAAAETVQQALEEGVCTVMSKPVDFSVMLARVKTLLDGPRVLVVEDSVDEGAGVVEVLLDHGLAARCCGSLKDARLVGDAWHPGGILVDQRLPDGLGEQLLREVHAPTSILCSGGHLDSVDAPHSTLMMKPLDLARVIRIFSVPPGAP
jgi:DNA-binding response OmpR family regulator